MTTLFQKTISKPGSLSGVGLHTGEACSVAFRPAPEGSGVRFFKNGKPVETAELDPNSQRCTSVGAGPQRIQTVEHLLAAVTAFQISNLDIDVTGPELPGLDGSAAPFAKILRELGLVTQSAKNEPFHVTEPLFCHQGLAALAIYPADEFTVSYVLDYDHPGLRNQKVDFTLTPEAFERDIAPARTFCTEKEAQELRKNGLGLGADLENTVVVSADGTAGRLRFDDECARHKVLDLIGDLGLLGFPVVGRIVGLRSGHSLNRKLVELIKKQRETMQTHKSKNAKTSMDVQAIKKILPHRYPFLLVDKIIEITDTRIVGIKNVTANEPFFQGHFPERPVMPGVLMIEALAQVGGVFVLQKSENVGKLAYLVSINNARFRKIVVPGDQLRLEVEVLKLKSRIGLVKGVAKVDGEEVCGAEIMFSLAD